MFFAAFIGHALQMQTRMSTTPAIRVMFPVAAELHAARFRAETGQQRQHHRHAADPHRLRERVVAAVRAANLARIVAVPAASRLPS